MNTESTSANGNVANVTLMNTESAVNEGHLLAIGRTYGGGRLGIVAPPEGNRADSPVPDQGLNHLLLRIRTSANASTSDLLDLWVNPDLSSEPQWENAQLRELGTRVLKNGVNQIRVRAEGAGSGQTPLNVSFDHLRIGRDWTIALMTDEEADDDPLGFAENENNVLIYPNPANTQIFVRFNKRGFYQFVLLDMSGNVVFDESINAKEYRIDLPNKISNGLYFIKIQDGEDVHTKRILITR
jgi:hypothetical protein